MNRVANETEVKLTFPADKLEQVLALKVLQGADFKGKNHLVNRYYDTPELALTQHKVALRIREQGEDIIQTVKTRGHSINGLHQRGEWEWLLDKPDLDLTLLAQAQWPDALPVEKLKGQLLPIFTTNFDRLVWWVTVNDTQIEVALDQGDVSYQCARDGELLKDAICELELELKSGAVEDLLMLKEQLQVELGCLVTSDISKAERGYRLFHQANRC